MSTSLLRLAHLIFDDTLELTPFPASKLGDLSTLNGFERKVMWSYWSGGKIPFPRHVAYLRLERYCKKNNILLVLVTEETFSQFAMPGHPIHEGFYSLSATHQSDYFRAYVLAHYGGFYSDIKPPIDWVNEYQCLEEATDKEALTMWYKYNLSSTTVGVIPPTRLAVCGRYLPLTGFAIARYRSSFFRDYLLAIETLLDDNLAALKVQDGRYHYRAIKGGVYIDILEAVSEKDEKGKPYPTGYPFDWFDLLYLQGRFPMDETVGERIMVASHSKAFSFHPLVYLRMEKNGLHHRLLAVVLIILLTWKNGILMDTWLWNKCLVHPWRFLKRLFKRLFKRN